jgi:membrane protein
MTAFKERTRTTTVATAKLLIKALKTSGEFLVKLYRDFEDTRCTTRAAALSYATVLAVVPLLAVTVSISQNFLKDASQDLIPSVLDRLIAATIPMLEYVPQEVLTDTTATDLSVPEAVPERSAAAREKIIKGITDFIDNINFRALGAVGMLVLLFVGVRLIETVENTVNDIWGVTRGRGRLQRLVYYWTAVTLGPLVIFLGLGASASYGLEKLGSLPGLRVIPEATSNLVVLWLFFTLLYAILPNTRVRFRAALAGGIVGGSLWRLNSLLSALYFRRVVTFSAIYGSLGLVLVVLVGIYFTWLIFLLGAQVSYTVQHIREYRQEKVMRRVNQAAMEFIALHMMMILGRRFFKGLTPATTEQLAGELAIPERVAGEVIHRLVTADLLAPISLGQSYLGYQPARDPHGVRLQDVLDGMRQAGAEWLDTAQSSDSEWLRTTIEKMRHGALDSGGSSSVIEGIRSGNSELLIGEN